MTTQLVEHERITTTLQKAKALRPYAEKVLSIAKVDANQRQIRLARKIITTDFASKKLFLEIAPRFKDRHSCYTRIVPMGHRRGDNAKMAYIEYLDNEIDKYEKAVDKQNRENNLVPNEEEFERKTFTQERDFFRERLNEIEEEEIRLTSQHESLLASGQIQQGNVDQERKNLQIKKKFFERKLQQVEHDLWIVNKNKYDLIKYATFA